MNAVKQITFGAIPHSLEQLRALPQAALATPFDTAALCVMALCAYPADKEQALQMLNYLRGPRPLSEFEKQFIRDRFTTIRIA